MNSMIALAVGEIVGSLTMGKFIDKIGLKNSSVINLFLILMAMGTVIYYLCRNHYGYFAYFMIFIWGLQDGSVSI